LEKLFKKALLLDDAFHHVEYHIHLNFVIKCWLLIQQSFFNPAERPIFATIFQIRLQNCILKLSYAINTRMARSPSAFSTSEPSLAYWRATQACNKRGK